MLDTGNIHDLLSREVPEWTSQTWEIDWDNKRLLTKRIDGKKAVAQGAYVALLTDYLEYDIFSDRFGSEFNKYIGKDPDLLKCNAERLVKECLAPDLRIERVINFEQEQRGNDLIIDFDLVCEDGIEHMELEVPLE